MDKQQVLDKLTLYYEEEMKENQFYQQGKENQELIIKLMQTTDLFVRSFDYDMPVGHTVKSKIANFIRRVIRRSTRFITKPYADKMQRYNESVCELLGEMIKQNGEKFYSIRQEMAGLKSKICEECQSKTSNIEDKIKEYKGKVSNVEDGAEKCSAKVSSIEEGAEALGAKTAAIEEMIDGMKCVLNDTVNKTLEMGGQLTVLSQGSNLDTNIVEGMSYSQTGEDKIVNFLLNYGERKIEKISYLDIGCNHYKNLNNTYSFYQKGHRGVLVEANPNFIDELKKYRPEDTVLNVGIGADESDSMNFYIVNNVDLSSFDKASIEEAQKESPWVEIVEEVQVPMMKMDHVIEQYCNGTPTMVSLDTEGLEMAILGTLDFEKYRPLVFIIETISYSAHIQIDKKRMDILNFMSEKGYGEFAFTGVNSIFVDKRQLD